MTYVAGPETASEEVVFAVDSPPDVPAGTYQGTLIGMRSFSYDTPEGETRNLIEWQFSAVTVDGEPIEVQGVTSLATGPKSKAFGWLVALLGASAVVPNATIRGSQLVGRDVLLTIGPDKKGWPKVMDLTALPRTRPAAKPALHDDDVAVPTPIRPAADGKVPGTEFDDLPF